MTEPVVVLGQNKFITPIQLVKCELSQVSLDFERTRQCHRQQPPFSFFFSNMFTYYIILHLLFSSLFFFLIIILLLTQVNT
ncbi:hypothetical protein RIF29_27682 [Crotalaria pallida]|uniref:Uncharacterized protein n=1 Tax=Crotalaria pallida TaxID=3830 RepID=A0AAN9EQG3_CROPI